MKPKLHLQDLATVAIKPAPVKEPPAKPVEPTPAEAPNVTPLPSPKPDKRFARPAPTPAHAEAREFTFLDGRPITLVKHAVTFFCPLKDAPEIATLVAVKGMAGPMPLAIPYSEFKAWAMAK